MAASSACTWYRVRRRDVSDADRREAVGGGLPYVANPHRRAQHQEREVGRGWGEVSNERQARDREFLNDFVPRRRLSLAGVTVWLRESDTIRLVTFEFSLRRRLRRLGRERCILEQQIEHATAKRDRNLSDAYKSRVALSIGLLGSLIGLVTALASR